MRGGMEAIYDNVPERIGLGHFAPGHEARGTMFSERRRLQISGESTLAAPVTEDQFYGSGPGKSSES
jgi:hypothetical protein